jgi:NAD+ synthetase
VVGSVVQADNYPPNHPGLYNAALLLNEGEVRMVAAKRLLPAYDVFFEPRWFLSGPPMSPLTLAGKQVGFLLGDDMYDEGYAVHPATYLLEGGAELLVCLSASPYYRRILERRLYHARRHGCAFAFANICGGNDELVFDGRSFVLDETGGILAQLSAFQEEFRVVDLNSGIKPKISEVDPQEEVFQALVLGVRDFFEKNRVSQAYLGLSGGVDSAVVAVIAAEALGPERVTAVAIPSRYSDPRSTSNARDLSGRLGIHFEVVGLEGLHVAAENELGDLLERRTAAENVQARLRGMILMGFVNRYGGLLLNTSNKTELALGYGTIYGDLAGTLCPIADLTKPQVIKLARWINKDRDVIPRFVLERPPSAELRLDQVDPFDYDEVGPEMERLVVDNRSNHTLRRSEHKRWQMGVVLKVSEKSFGSGRLIPITRR